MAAPTLAPTRTTPPTGRVRPRRTPLLALPEMRWATIAVTFFCAGLAVQLTDGPRWLFWGLYLVCYAAGGWEPGWAGLRALRDKTLDVDLLMVAAALGAAAIGQITDGALLIVIFATSGALEALATARTEDSVRGLLDLAPDTATRVTRTGEEETVHATALSVGDVLVVRPGERIAADATVVSGGSEVDQATITGEPLPVNKTEGDEVFAGTLNGTGALRVRVERRAQDSVVARIAALVEEASRTKARTQLFLEKVEQRYSVGMVAATLAVFAVPLLLGDTVRRALLRAMTFMIVASPCAVVLATMPPLLAAIANAGRHGVLVKSAVVMEKLGATTQVAFDKTGTLTRGIPELAEIRCLNPRFTDTEVLRLAAAAEHPSEHPLAAAIVRAARARELRLPEVTDFTAHPGRGVTARVGDHLVGVGSPTASGPERESQEAVDALHASGYTVVVVTCDRRPIGVLALTDQDRPEAVAAVRATTEVTGSAPVLLTGDNSATAERLAARVGITDVRAALLPDDKVTAVRELQADGRKVTVVGDGINDAPALAAAEVGIAMGGAGSDLTLQTADAVVVRDDLTAIPAVIALSRQARRVVIANLSIAATFIGVLVVWDLAATLPLPLGVAGHEGSTVLVGLNGLRLLRTKAWERAARARD
ncbi:heavy metal translocating P-type ATPase [Nocardia sp. CDC186]|uniref:Heavy metal translocating P-type ATPase n=1 Tax=Nocardia implantans TaxID=3108168 RepID=A0ABU6ASL1_9NOCA|nr:MULTISPECIES: heavy metal translocating P-type ATPase [unclassified Nocardia]MBF6191782.1 cadmium-translocating P-type ATPase [Nocardia beijingensis]MEA3527907.1 heavy metal translocating P-type ATPase [Nocardia sp. CDC192]MEB3510341.1 heavy metal translocating P-type ATPase [Nocardia sp. CDC186]